MIVYSTRLQNIEDTEKAKRKLIDETQREESEVQPYEGKHEKIIHAIDFTKLNPNRNRSCQFRKADTKTV